RRSTHRTCVPGQPAAAHRADDLAARPPRAAAARLASDRARPAPVAGSVRAAAPDHRRHAGCGARRMTSSEAHGRLPDFFIVGHAKSGTTAMYEMLRPHPEIFMPEVKETWYFARELRSPLRKGDNPRHPETLEGYLALFAGAQPGQKLGEATPSYLYSHESAARIAELCPDARI